MNLKNARHRRVHRLDREKRVKKSSKRPGRLTRTRLAPPPEGLSKTPDTGALKKVNNSNIHIISPFPPLLEKQWTRPYSNKFKS